MLVPSESSGVLERDDFPLQSNAVPSLQLQATGVSAPEAFQDLEPSPEPWISLERWEPPQAVLSTPQRGHRLVGRATCPSAQQLGLAVGAPATQ